MNMPWIWNFACDGLYDYWICSAPELWKPLLLIIFKKKKQEMDEKKHFLDADT